MPRKSIGSRPLTGAERQAQQRQKKAAEVEALREELRRIYKPLRSDNAGVIGYVIRSTAAAVYTYKDPDRCALLGRALGMP